MTLYFFQIGTSGPPTFSPRPLGEGQGEGGFGAERRGRRCFSPRPLGEGQGEGGFGAGCRDRRRFSPRLLGEGQGEGKFGAGRRGRRCFSPRPLGEGQGEGGFGAGRHPIRMPFRAWLQRRVGLEPTPTIFFSTTGRRGRRRFSPRPFVNSRSKFTSHSRVMFTTHDRVDGYHQKAQIYNLAFLIASFLREIWR